MPTRILTRSVAKAIPFLVPTALAGKPREVSGRRLRHLLEPWPNPGEYLPRERHRIFGGACVGRIVLIYYAVKEVVAEYHLQ